MTPAADGRHCAACQTVVVDFTRMSDQQLLAYLQQHPAVSCGRFDQHQLGRTLGRARPAGGPRWLGALAALLGLSALAAPTVRGQRIFGAGPTPMSQLPAEAGRPAREMPPARANAAPEATEAAAGLAAPELVLIRGVLLAPGGTPRAGAEVFIACNGQWPDTTVVTDAAGRFQVALPLDSLRQGGWMSARILPRWGFMYQAASLDIASTPQPFYQLQLHRKRKRRYRHTGKFR